eukprot:SAG22_NODE_182_length_16036_cov_13.692226_3_plen_179_part_00
MALAASIATRNASILVLVLVLTSPIALCHLGGDYLILAVIQKQVVIQALVEEQVLGKVVIQGEVEDKNPEDSDKRAPPAKRVSEDLTYVAASRSCRPAPPGKAVEQIVAHTYDEDGNPADYLVRWGGIEDTSWVPAGDLDCFILLARYWEREAAAGDLGDLAAENSRLEAPADTRSRD